MESFSQLGSTRERTTVIETGDGVKMKAVHDDHTEERMMVTSSGEGE